MILFTRITGIRYPYPLIFPGEKITYIPKGILVDNGAYGFFIRGRFPSLKRWTMELLSAARRMPSNLPLKIMILPDYPLDGKRTIEWLRSTEVRLLAEELHSRGWILLGVAHQIRELQGFYETATELLILDYVDGIAAPLKLPCRSPRGGASISCQLRIAAQVSRAAREMGVKWAHGLGVLLKKDVVERLGRMGFTSIDSTSWKYVYDKCGDKCGIKVERGKPRRVKSKRERECILECIIEYLGLSTPPPAPAP